MLEWLYAPQKCSCHAEAQSNLRGSVDDEPQARGALIQISKLMDRFPASQLAGPGAAGAGLQELAGGSKRSPEAVRNALWTAHQLLDVGSAKVDKRVLIFTCDPNPPGTGVTADTNRHAPPASPCPKAP